METENAIQQDPQAALVAKRQAQNKRKAAQRQRDRDKKQEAKAVERAEEQLEEVRADEGWGVRDVIRRGVCFLGEVAPGREAKNIHEALFSARQFARALHVDDVKLGESVTDFEHRVFDAWVTCKAFAFENSRHHYYESGSAPFLNIQTGQLSPGWGGGMFHWEHWSHLPGADKGLTPEQIRESGTL
jgi:hypothetical protein